ncbi:MAG: pyruvate, phosphate dikinase [Candidatus Krumholzibacteria bacterium]
MSQKHVYYFGGGNADGSAQMRNELGGKGANLAEMTNLGIPVPPGFTISTGVCTHFMESGGEYPDGVHAELADKLQRLEQEMGSGFGDAANPLLVSVRSGSRVSMPGMMDTVLNLGLNDRTVEGLIQRTGNPRFAYDSYRRFIDMYGNVVLGVAHHLFEEILARRKKAAGVQVDNELSVDDLKQLIGEYTALVEREQGKPFPQDPESQLRGAIDAVFHSWNGNRAVVYRRIHGIPNDWGTAVNVQAMVFGNMGDDCATGVAFTRDPGSGEAKFFGEYLINAQGEDVVAGIRTPLPISADAESGADQSLESVMPGLYGELVAIFQKLEKHYKDMQDIEFTIQKGKLWLLQTRNGKRTGRAAVRIAVDMVREGLIDKRQAISRVEPEQLEQLLHRAIDPGAEAKPFAKGLPASPGAASGLVAFSVEEVLERVRGGEKVILVRLETSPEDVEGMKAADAILTARGGMTSHAAVVARGMGKCCVAGCSALQVDYKKKLFRVGDQTFNAGDPITVDGSTGNVFAGTLPTVDPVLDDCYHEFMKWADDHRKLRVRANADTPEDARKAVEFGAEGIGLARTEHMFFKEDRIPVVREMIMASNREERMEALRKIRPMQAEDFLGVFREMQGRPVTIRLLDPPLHEFLPHEEKDIENTARLIGRSPDEIRSAIARLHEFNPMLGHRGCRLGITYPEIYETQTEAIIEAAISAKKEGIEVNPEIMIPLVGIKEELKQLRELVLRVASEVIEREGVEVAFLVGTMIEVPRAALVADQIGEVADFFSFGTNDLTQMTYGFSRDDSVKFLEDYVSKGVLPGDPFATLDRDGVGELVRRAVEAGRRANPKLKLGICGEHGGDPSSIEFCHEVGLDYVSCSPFRVPVARLAAAQAALGQDRREVRQNGGVESDVFDQSAR